MPIYQQLNLDIISFGQFKGPYNLEFHKKSLSKDNEIYTFLDFYIQVLNPKSINLGDILSSKIIFYNFISRCAIFLSCRYFKAPANYLMIFLHYI